MRSPLDSEERDVVIGRALSALEDVEIITLTAAQYSRTADAAGRAMWRDPIDGHVCTQVEAIARVRREYGR